MSFRVKTFNEILSDMADWITSSNSRLTNFTTGSVVRTLLESVSAEIEEMYFQIYRGFKYGVENGVYDSFDFQTIGATAATGTVMVVFKDPLQTPLVIPQGYQISTSRIYGEPIVFEVDQDYIADYGYTVIEVSVTCTQTGEIGNVAENTINSPVIRLAQVDYITNTTATSGGKEEESEQERKSRFTNFINSLQRGTANSIKYGCLSVYGVAGAYVEDGIGVVNVYVHDASGSLSAELRSELETTLLDYRPAGIYLNLLPVVTKLVDLDISITISANYDTETMALLVNSHISSYLNSFPVSKPLRVSEIIREIMNVDKYGIYDCKLNNISQDVTVFGYELVRPGDITVTASN